MKTGISDSGLNLTHDRFLQLPVPLPPLSEQRRIVYILEEHLSRLDAAATALAAAEMRLNAWAASLVDVTVWGNGWPQRQVGDLLREPMRNGRSDRVVLDDLDGEAGVRTLTLTAVTRNEFIEHNTKLTCTSPARAEGLWLRPGDIFVQRANTPELVGTAARYDGGENWAIFPDLLIRLRADESVIESEFMVAALRSERAHRALRARAKGLAGSMPKVDQAAVAATKIPVPAVVDQRRIVVRLNEVAGATDLMRNSLIKQARRGRSLRRALLTAAFAGKLTGRHTDDEVIEEMAQ